MLQGTWRAAFIGMVTPVAVCAQSTHLIALENAAPTVEPTAGVPQGLISVFRDPTLSPRATGALISMYRTRTALQVFHGITAFKWGPRWSLAFASTEIGQLFDTSLTNQDPGLSALRARALIGSLDATLVEKLGSVSMGLAVAADELIGTVSGSTLLRIRARMFPLGTEALSLGFHWSGVVGGTLPAAPGGRSQVGVGFAHDWGAVRASTALALYRGAHWRYSETIGGYAISARVEILSSLHFDVGAGRYRTSYGVESHEWLRSASGGLSIKNLTFDVRYTSTALGLGSGYGVTLGYEPRLSKAGHGDRE